MPEESALRFGECTEICMNAKGADNCWHFYRTVEAAQSQNTFHKTCMSFYRPSLHTRKTRAQAPLVPPIVNELNPCIERSRAGSRKLYILRYRGQNHSCINWFMEMFTHAEHIIQFLLTPITH